MEFHSSSPPPRRVFVPPGHRRVVDHLTCVLALCRRTFLTDGVEFVSADDPVVCQTKPVLANANANSRRSVKRRVDAHYC